MDNKFTDIEKAIIHHYNSDDVPSSFVEYLSQYSTIVAPLITQYLESSSRLFEERKHPDLYKYLYDPLMDYTSNFGKLHRPLTCLAAYKACTKSPSIDKVFPVAAALEHFQTAALIHDDIADGASVRRGMPCFYKTYGTALAINSGDFGLCMVIGCLIDYISHYSKFSKDTVLWLIEELVKMQYMTIEGQAMDLGWAKEECFNLSEADYFVMAKKKTAYYSVSLPFVLGAICADADKDTIENLRDAGINLGLAFQIQDDLLNICSNQNNKAKFQKDFMSDISEGKKTLIVVKALELASNKDKQNLINILQEHTDNKDKLYEAVEIMSQCGSIDYAKNTAYQLASNAKLTIEGLQNLTDWKSLLLDMCLWAVNREI